MIKETTTGKIENPTLWKEYGDRIDGLRDEEVLYAKIGAEYDLGDIISHQIIETGYEDYNVVLGTENGKYFLKIFSNERSDELAVDLVNRATVAVEAGIATPKIYPNQRGELLSLVEVGDSRFRLTLTDYIDGQDFYSLQQKPTDDELTQIVQIAADLQKIDYQPLFVYDSWAISSFAEEFEKKQKLLSSEHLELVRPVYEKFKKFDYDGLPKGYTHGDMIVTNLIKDEAGKIWLVDYSVANYTVRLNEIAVICCDVATRAGDEAGSRRRIAQTFEAWCEKVGATEFEKESFPLLLDVINAIHIMNASVIKTAGNNSVENEYFLKAGLFGLSLREEVLENE
jgi:Ser/Thr protein kinase RdoA (MazF antagonist)